MNEVFLLKRVGNISIPPGYENTIYTYVEREVDSIFHQKILEPLFGRVSIREGQHDTIIVRLITTIHSNSHTVGISLPEYEFERISEREIADKLFHSFLHSFGVLALSAFLNPRNNEEGG